MISSQTKPRRDELPKDVNLCEYCTAKCCHYFALPIDTPETPEDFDFIRWYLLHERASVFLDEGDGTSWYTRPASICSQTIAVAFTRRVRRSAVTTPQKSVNTKTIGRTTSISKRRSRFRVRRSHRPSEEKVVAHPTAAALAGLVARMRIQPRTLQGFRDFLPAA